MIVDAMQMKITIFCCFFLPFQMKGISGYVTTIAEKCCEMILVNSGVNNLQCDLLFVAVHYYCAHEGRNTKQRVYHDNDLGCERVREVRFREHTPRSTYMQRTTVHLLLARTLQLQHLLGRYCSQRAMVLMLEAFSGDPFDSKMTLWLITRWGWRPRPPPASTKAAWEGLINNLAAETQGGHDLHCFMHKVKSDESCFVVCLSIPNLIRNARSNRREH